MEQIHGGTSLDGTCTYAKTPRYPCEGDDESSVVFIGIDSETDRLWEGYEGM